MSTSAPRVRTVDAFTGARPPTTFFRALSEADSFCERAESVDGLRAENAALRERLADVESELREHRRTGLRRGW